LVWVARELGYLKKDKFNLLKKQIEKVGSLLGGFKNYLLRQ